MKFVANLVGRLSIPIYYLLLAYLFSAPFFACIELSELFFAVTPWFLGPAGWFFVLPVGVTLSIWLGHMTCRFLLRKSTPGAGVTDKNKAGTGEGQPGRCT